MNLRKDGEARRLRDNFLGGISEVETAKMQDSLARSPRLAERYRRLQLAERVAAHGPQEALERPSPAEVDRVAARLGLLEPEPAPSVWRARFAPWMFGAALAVSAALALFTVMPSAQQDVLRPRGGAATGASFSAYVVRPGGGFERIEPGARLGDQDRLKLRLSWSGAASALDAVWVVVVDGSGRVEVTRLEPPAGALGAVPGVVGLWACASGVAKVYMVAAPTPLTKARLRAAVDGEPSAEVTASRLDAAGVQRFEVVIEPGGEAEP